MIFVRSTRILKQYKLNDIFKMNHMKCEDKKSETVSYLTRAIRGIELNGKADYIYEHFHFGLYPRDPVLVTINDALL